MRQAEDMKPGPGAYLRGPNDPAYIADKEAARRQSEFPKSIEEAMENKRWLTASLTAALHALDLIVNGADATKVRSTLLYALRTTSGTTPEQALEFQRTEPVKP